MEPRGRPGRHRQHHLPARAELIERWGSSRSASTSAGTATCSPSDEYDDLDAFYARLRESPSAADDLAALGRRLPAPSTSRSLRGRAATSSRSTSPAGLSGTCESAREAARIARRARACRARIEVVDGADRRRRPRLPGPRRRERRRGAAPTPTRSSPTVRRTREPLDIWFCLDTLEYLRRGGRIGAAQALVGSALKIKPILTFGTEIAPVGRVRTHKRGASSGWSPTSSELHERGATDWIVQHAQSPDDAEQLVAERGTEILGSRAAVLHPGRARCSAPTSARGCSSAASASLPPPAPADAQPLSTTDTTLPAGSLNQAISGPPLRKMPVSSVSIGVPA